MNMQYIRVGDYYIPDLELPRESRPVGKWGRMHRDYLKPIQYNCLFLSGELWTYLADLNKQAQDRLERMIDQMTVSEGIAEALKASDPMAWVQRMNNIHASAEEIIRIQYVVITMGCNVQCPFLPCKWREDWGLDDPTGQPDEVFLETMCRIEEKVLALRERLR